MIRSTSALFFHLENLAFSLHFTTKESDLFFSFHHMTELRPSGFPEYSPSQQLIFDQLRETIEQSYQQF